ncbi:hypothetical protein BGX23_000915, partial [Mortierella sp. AD031]
ISLFNLEDRTVQSPFKLRERCDRFCTSLASPEAQSTTETTSPSGLDLNHELSTTSVVINGRRENLYFVTFAHGDRFQQPDHGVEYPDVSSREFRLQLVHTVDIGVTWKLCPHRQLHGIRTGPSSAIIELYLDDPLRNSQRQFLGGIRYLLEVFESAGDVVKQDIIQYVGKYINCCLLDDNLGGNIMVDSNIWDIIRVDSNPPDNAVQENTPSDNIVPYICNSWTPVKHESTLQFMNALLTDQSVRWIPKHMKDLSNNPIHIMLEAAETFPKVFEIAEVVINHCFRQAKLDKDPYLLLPIRQCLRYLTDP